MNWNFDCLWQFVTKQFRSPKYSVHGPEHWRRVERNGLLLATRSGADIAVVRLFALFHDSRRQNDGRDDGHGSRGAEYAKTLHGVAYDLPNDRFELLYYACVWHTEGEYHDDPTIATCWDADRLDLGRVGTVPDPDFMSTDFGREIAACDSIEPFIQSTANVHPATRVDPQNCKAETRRTNVSKFVILPCLDSEQMAASRHRELDISRYAAASLGWSALEAIRKGFYVTGAGQEVSWRDAVQAACAAKRSIDPDATLPSNERIPFPETKVQVTNETTLGASLRFVKRGLRPLALNFANGVHPGGGFLGGARAQEEVLCRSSALYETLVDDPMYREHRKRPEPDSTDWAIYSPDIPVFRADDGTAVTKFLAFERHYVCCPLCPRHRPTAIRRSFEETNSPRARHRTVLRIQHVGAGRVGLWRLPQ